jgi:hypothetical protein
VNDRVTGARRALRRWFAGVTTQSIGLSGNEIARALISMMALCGRAGLRALSQKSSLPQPTQSVS